VEVVSCHGGVDITDVDKHWVVEWVATRPEYRRRGLVNQLLTRVLDIGMLSHTRKRTRTHRHTHRPRLRLRLRLTLNERTGREKGYKRAQVSIVVGNDAALRAYEKQGFSEYSTITSPLISRHMNTAGVINLRMDL
jgi:ribosomal protein S18 acetylase RimI-like enzyme